MAGAAGKIAWKVLGYGFAIPTGIAVRKAMDAGWKFALGSVPPKNPAAAGTTWKDALGWAAASGMGIAAGRLVAARGAAGAYRTLTGHLPPGLEESGP
ncbi:hypothetical protein BH20ACT5_BH20ACT5_23080 [soil metagenome]